MARTLRIWAAGDAHVSRDMRHGRESLADAIRQSERGGADGGPPFEWDIGINVGDYCGTNAAPADEEGPLIVDQFAALADHRREQIYSIAGNHDRSGLTEPEAWWFRKWIDPLGEHPESSGVDAAAYPYPIDGTWERYRFRVGNLLFLMMSDVNEASQTLGRGDLGGNPAGVVTHETFDWWHRQVRDNPDCVIVSAHHYVLKDTTVASGDWEGFEKDAEGKHVRRYHRYYAEGTPIGASYLYWVGGEKDSGAFESVLAEDPGCVALWLGGHTHTNPDDCWGGKSHVETRWGTTFVNVAALTRHGAELNAMPMSRLFTFTEGSDQVRIQCYMHTSEYRSQGWYAAAERTVRLPKPVLLPA